MRNLLTLAAFGFAATLAFAATPAMACGGCGYAPESINEWNSIDGGDSHYYEVYADAGETMFVELFGDGYADLDVFVTNEQGRTVAEGISMEGCEIFDWVARREGVYFVEVRNIESRGYSDYELTVY